MVTLKYQGQNYEQTTGGKTVTLGYTGTLEEILAFAAEEEVGTYNTEYGVLVNERHWQDGGNIWACEKKYSQDRNGNGKEPPNILFGKKSATSRGSVLALPIEACPKYLTNWNHYLFAAPGVTAIPAWWATEKTAIMSSEDAQKYAWGKSLGDCPVDSSGRWHVIKDPVKPGQTNWDVATYSVTETAKFANAKAAGKMQTNTLNKIGFPSETFGNSGGNWKCDDCTVQWQGDAWYATLTWTKSGDNNGWDTDLYGSV
ncbi:MAG: hypothetical protein IJI85_10300 [Clostridia bacterium]|nr:hypothetical protein [Lentisphaeria bacterium]MBR0422950.1 hypothetical protein [Clostridia bacterium]